LITKLSVTAWTGELVQWEKDEATIHSPQVVYFLGTTNVEGVKAATCQISRTATSRTSS
jgi:hypothetical protein